ncbi:MAG: DUF4065 domain-containing protein [Alphaproteobacteria bacterium]
MSSRVQSVSVDSVADYLLMKIDPEAGDSITNMKLQKLLYYCQGWHLAAYGVPLFNASIEAWEHGPVVRGVWGRFSRHGPQSIPPDEARPDRAMAIPEPMRRLIDDVWDRYGEMHAYRLRDMTHEEAPWREVYREDCRDAVIPDEAMRLFFDEESARLLDAAELGPVTDPASLEWARTAG